MPTLKVALAGNPNTGKTSLFNALTGSIQHVGNYPGVTVEKREGKRRGELGVLELEDLPGTYSLNSYSPEERIAQKALLSENYDVVILVADASNLGRSLVLMAQVMQTGQKMVLCLNMIDEAKASGIQIDKESMTQLLGMPVVETVAHRGGGIDNLEQAIYQADQGSAPKARLVLGQRMDHALEAINIELEEQRESWTATRLLLNEQLSGIPSKAVEVAARQRALICEKIDQDIDLFVIERYFGFVDGLLKEVLKQRSSINARALSDRIDRVLVNRILGIPIFALMLYGLFWFTFELGSIPMDWIDAGFGALGEWVLKIWPEESALRSLIVDGIIAGVGGVLIFLPNILILFLGLAFLEDSGYLARAAFLLDRFMHRFGLHGKSFIPMVTGLGCTIPGIMATRTLENERDRLTTMMVLPLISCGARLPIWMLLLPALFPLEWQAPMLWGIYFTGIALALLLARLLKSTLLGGLQAPFVMELPPYRMPTMKAVIGRMLERSGLYVKKAGTIILAISILMWVFTSYPKPSEEELQAMSATAMSSMSAEELESLQAGLSLEYSIAGRIGKVMEPIFSPLGYDWKINTALLGAFAAKEVFVAQMGIVHSIGEVNEDSGSLRSLLRKHYSPLVGLSLILFMLISAPCMATVAITRRESGSWRWALFQFFSLTIIAYLISLGVYQVGGLFWSAS